MGQSTVQDWSDPVVIGTHSCSAVETPLWRYMSLTKFIYLVSTGKLYFPLASQFEDPFDGHLPKKIFEAVTKNASQDQCMSETDKKYFIASYKNYRSTRLVSCWHVSESESEAMWKLYDQEKQAIAIKTTTRRLINSLKEIPEHAKAGLVKYIDFNNPPELIPPDPAYLKRLSYQHEREFRVTFNQQSLFPLPHGDSYKCDLELLVEEIHISPWADDLFHHAVEHLAKTTLTHNPTIYKSELLSEPSWFD